MVKRQSVMSPEPPPDCIRFAEMGNNKPVLSVSKKRSQRGPTEFLLGGKPKSLSSASWGELAWTLTHTPTLATCLPEGLKRGLPSWTALPGGGVIH